MIKETRIEPEKEIFDEDFKEWMKFLVFMLTFSVTFHELGHFIVNTAVGIDPVKFCLYGFCYTWNESNYDFDVGVEVRKVLSWGSVLGILGGFIFQFIFSYLLLKIMKVRIPKIFILLFLICILDSIDDFILLWNIVNFKY